MLTTVIIGQKITKARKNKNLSQAELAELLFISPQAVGKWERGESMPDIITFNRLAETLGVDLNYFSENFSSSSQTIVEETNANKQADENPKNSGWDMSKGNWIGADFSDLKNLSERFSYANIQNCVFINSELAGLLLKGNNVQQNDFSQALLSKSQFENSNITNNTFKQTLFTESNFIRSHINDCDFTDADFTESTFKSCALQKSTFAGVKWLRTAFKNSTLENFTFTGAMTDCSFENCSFNKVIFQQVTLTNTFFKNKTLKKIKFIDCHVDKLTYAFLKNGNADLSGISLLVAEES